MKNLLLAGVLLMGGVPAFAWETPASESPAWHYEGSEDYEAVAFSVADAAFLGSAALGAAFAADNTAAWGVAPVLVGLSYGAWRTAQYRPDAAKATVRQNLAKQHEAAKYGTVYTIPNQ